jgi:hypothetical protein
MDLRGSQRVAVPHLWIALPHGAVATRGNISTGGIGFEVDGCPPLRAGDPIVVRVAIPETGEPLALSATICRVHYDDRRERLYVGARFVDVDLLTEFPLFRFVEETALLSRTAL